MIDIYCINKVLFLQYSFGAVFPLLSLFPDLPGTLFLRKTLKPLVIMRFRGLEFVPGT